MNGISIHLWSEEFRDMTIKDTELCYTRPDGTQSTITFPKQDLISQNSISEHKIQRSSNFRDKSPTSSSSSIQTPHLDASRGGSSSGESTRSEERSQKSILDFMKELSNLKEQMKNMHSDYVTLNNDYSEMKEYSRDETGHMRVQITKIQDTFTAFKDHHNKFTAAHNKLADTVTGATKDIEKLYKIVQSSKSPTNLEWNSKGRQR